MFTCLSNNAVFFLCIGRLQVEELEKEIVESKEKIKFYSEKMQELVSIFVVFFLSILLNSSI
jgi:hypothetical protein